jgi:hypothetical protein
VRKHVLANAPRDALGDDTGHLMVRVRKQDDEFLAADARNHVAAS